MRTIASRFSALSRSVFTPNLRLFLESRQPLMWLLSILGGILAGVAAIIFRECISLIQLFWLADGSENVASAVSRIHWTWVLFAPAVGGLIVGLSLQFFLARSAGVADVIESCTKGRGGAIDARTAVGSAFVSAVSLGFGASAGREGPIVHLGASLSNYIQKYFVLPSWGRRTLIACGVAGAVSASFNAPIAGVLFAHEVILGHYSKRSFIPIVLSSVTATIISRVWFGNVAAFDIPNYQITSYIEFPAFALLGVLCALVAIIFQFSIIGLDYVARSIHIPLWTRPVIGGLVIGGIGIFFPQILGVGYEATQQSLNNELPVTLLLTLLITKTLATAITLASRFGGGVFSPSLYLGAMAGGAFGLIAASILPEMAYSQALYSILGMGAVAAAVLGAPISTIVMIFELTGGYALSIALFVTVSICVGLNQAFHGRSFFQWQLEMRGLRLRDGPHSTLLSSILVSDFMERSDSPDESAVPDDVPHLTPDMLLDRALRIFDESGVSRLPVFDNSDVCIGWATQVSALQVYNRQLIETSVEEHR